LFEKERTISVKRTLVLSGGNPKRHKGVTKYGEQNPRQNKVILPQKDFFFVKGYLFF